MSLIRLCYVEVGSCDGKATTTTLSSRLTDNLGGLLPNGSKVYGVSYYTSGRTATANVLLGFTDEGLWKEWVLKGFGTSTNESVELADQLWRDYGTYLFSAAALNSAWNGSGWAATTMAEHSGRKNGPQTPQHFFKYSKVDLQHGKYGEWYDGPGMVDEFLLETELHIQSHGDSGVIIGQRFW
jgi:hypothetical protein